MIVTPRFTLTVLWFGPALELSRSLRLRVSHPDGMVYVGFCCQHQQMEYLALSRSPCFPNEAPRFEGNCAIEKCRYADLNENSPDSSNLHECLSSSWVSKISWMMSQCWKHSKNPINDRPPCTPVASSDQGAPPLLCSIAGFMCVS